MRHVIRASGPGTRLAADRRAVRIEDNAAKRQANAAATGLALRDARVPGAAPQLTRTLGGTPAPEYRYRGAPRLQQASGRLRLVKGAE